MVGRNERSGAPFVHIKIFKQGRVYGEVVVESGTTWIRCRDCSRWHALNIRIAKIDASQQPLPESFRLVT